MRKENCDEKTTDRVIATFKGNRNEINKWLVNNNLSNYSYSISNPYVIDKRLKDKYRLPFNLINPYWHTCRNILGIEVFNNTRFVGNAVMVDCESNCPDEYQGLLILETLCHSQSGLFHLRFMDDYLRFIWDRNNSLSEIVCQKS
jgi:hypothetical protein